MNKVLKIVFAQFYEWGCQYNFANTPHLSAMYMLAALLTLNLGTLSMVVLYLIRCNIDYFFKPQILLFVCGIITGIIYFHYTKDKRYLKIYNEYVSNSLAKRKKYRLIIISYVYITFIILFGLAYLLGLHERGLL